VVGKFIERALENEPLLIHGDGEQTRDFTFVEDAAEATVLAALSGQTAGMIYNVGTGAETSINQLAQLIIQATHSSSRTKYVERRDIDNIQRRVLCADRLQQELSFSPRFSLVAGLKLTIDWFKENKKTTVTAPDKCFKL
jgi:UDP-glucose 4-epimerase